MKKDMLETDLIGTKTTKTDERIIFFGTVDELSSHLMALVHDIDNQAIKDYLVSIIRELSNIMGIVAGGKNEFSISKLDVLQEQIKKYQDQVKFDRNFILPGKTKLSSNVHIVRCVARRAELAYACVYEKYGGNQFIFEYLNKLSTLFYYLALYIEQFL